MKLQEGLVYAFDIQMEASILQQVIVSKFTFMIRIPFNTSLHYQAILEFSEIFIGHQVILICLLFAKTKEDMDGTLLNLRNIPQIQTEKKQ